MVFLLLTLLLPADAFRNQTSSPCVALMLPSVRGAEGDATATATSLRDLLSTYLTGPKLRVVNVDARLPVQAIEEASEKQCAPVLVVTLTRKRHDGSGVGKALGRAAGSAAWYVPYGGGGAATAIRGAAIAGASVVSELASSTRAKDELTIDYRIARPDAVNGASRRETLKAKTDGEDLVTPLVERVAESVVLELGKSPR